MRDLYDILEVPRDASQEEIKSAYRRLAFEYHPDHNPDDEQAEERFQAISQAYEVLKDPQRRRRYDRRGSIGGGDFGLGDFSVRRGVEAFSKFMEMFGAFFDGEEADRPRARRGEDVRVSIEVTLEEAISGAKKSVEAPGWRECRRCGGHGAAPEADRRRCQECRGRGEVRTAGFFGPRRECPECEGAGTVPEQECGACEGRGVESYDRDVDIQVPPGVRDGQALRRVGEGRPGRHGGRAGDLLFDVDLQPHPDFKRRGDDVYTEVDVSFQDASLGAKIRVPTLEGDVEMTLPPGSTSGDRFRLRGRGFSDPRHDTQGDQYVDIVVQTPVGLTARQRERMVQKSADGAEQDESGLGSFLKRFFQDAL